MPNAVGRPTELTEELSKQIFSAILAGNYRYVAAQAAGVSMRTFERWMKRGLETDFGIHHDFRRGVIQAETLAEMGHVDILRNAAKIDPKWSAWWLERKVNERWGPDKTILRELTKEVRELKKVLDERRSQPAEPVEG